MAMQAYAQMNVRMLGSLKEAGDKVLMESGTTPTQIVRSLWEKIARGPADLQQVKETLDMAVSTKAAVVDEPTTALDAMQRGRDMFAARLATWGIAEEEAAEHGSVRDTDLYTRALIDRMEERDVW